MKLHNGFVLGIKCCFFLLNLHDIYKSDTIDRRRYLFMNFNIFLFWFELKLNAQQEGAGTTIRLKGNRVIFIFVNSSILLIIVIHHWVEWTACWLVIITYNHPHTISGFNWLKIAIATKFYYDMINWDGVFFFSFEWKIVDYERVINT